MGKIRVTVSLNALQQHTDSNLAPLAPILDQAIDQLEAEDRRAILLRYFEQCDLHSVGHALGSTEEAARKRVSRALGKLQSLLQRQGDFYRLTFTGVTSPFGAHEV